MSKNFTRGLMVSVLTMGALAFSAGQAFATTINDSGEETLQEILDGITTDGPNCPTPSNCHSSIDVNTDQVDPHAHWSIGGTGTSASQMIIEIAGNASVNSFGIYNTQDGQQFELFNGADAAGAQLSFSFGMVNGEVVAVANNAGAGGSHNGHHVSDPWAGSNNLFGFYLKNDDNVFYSDANLNNNGEERLVGFQGTGADKIELPSSVAPGTWLSNEYVFGWEDQNDFDYNDFVVMVESVNPVPEPSAIAMLGFGLLGLGVFLRRRRSQQ